MHADVLQTDGVAERPVDAHRAGVEIVDLANAFHRGDSLGGQVHERSLNEMRGNWVLRFQGNGRP